MTVAFDALQDASVDSVRRQTDTYCWAAADPHVGGLGDSIAAVPEMAGRQLDDHRMVVAGDQFAASADVGQSHT